MKAHLRQRDVPALIASGGVVAAMLVVTASPGQFTGTVTSDLCQAIKPAAGAHVGSCPVPVAGDRVTLQRLGRVVTVTTDHAGRFRVSLHAGTWQVAVDPAGGTQFGQVERFTVTIRAARGTTVAVTVASGIV